MIIKIKRIDKTLPLPQYQTRGSVALDLYSRIDAEIAPGKIVLLPSNIVVETPPGFMLVIAARSSLPLKKGLSIPNGIGIIDEDYHGPEDEIKIQVYNFTDKSIKIEKGERLAQGIFVPIAKVQMEEVEEMNNENRGGFGSTGEK